MWPKDPLCFSFFDRSRREPDLTVKATLTSISPRFLFLPSCPGLLLSWYHLFREEDDQNDATGGRIWGFSLCPRPLVDIKLRQRQGNLTKELIHTNKVLMKGGQGDLCRVALNGNGPSQERKVWSDDANCHSKSSRAYSSHSSCHSKLGVDLSLTDVWNFSFPSEMVTKQSFVPIHNKQNHHFLHSSLDPNKRGLTIFPFCEESFGSANWFKHTRVTIQWMNSIVILLQI